MRSGGFDIGRGWNSGNFYHRTNFHSSPLARGKALGDIDGFVEVLYVNQQEATELFAGFGKRAVGDEPFTVYGAHAGGGGGGMQRRRQDILSLARQRTGEGGGLLVTLGPLCLRRAIFLQINK